MIALHINVTVPCLLNTIPTILRRQPQNRFGGTAFPLPPFAVVCNRVLIISATSIRCRIIMYFDRIINHTKYFVNSFFEICISAYKSERRACPICAKCRCIFVFAGYSGVFRGKRHFTNASSYGTEKQPPPGLFPLVDSVLAVNDFAYRENPHYLSRRPLSNSGFQP